jgi:Zn-dependent protease with chaperone function
VIRLLLGLLGTLAIAGLSDIVPLEGPPRPIAWCTILAAAAAAFTGSKALSRALAARPAPAPWPLQWAGVAVHLGAYAAVLYPLGWARWALIDLRWRGESFATLLLLLAPAAAIALWLAPWAYFSERRGAGPDAAPRSFPRWLLDGSRPVLAATLGFLGIAWAAGRLEAIPAVGEAMALHRSVDAGLAVVALLALFAASPCLVLLAWPSAPFPPGGTWDGLSRIAAGSRLRRGAIRVWDDRTASVLNACVVGLIPSTRRVFFTRGMKDLLGPGELSAVLAHELGHVRRGHLGLHAIAAGSFLVSLAPLDRAAAPLPSWLSGALLLLYAAAYWALLFGRASRWLEVEADLAGAGAVGMEAYAATLEKVGACLGPAARKDGWRHFSLEKRLGLLARSREDPGFGAALARRFRSFRGALLAVAALSAGGFAAAAALDLGRPREEIAVESARLALAEADDLGALLEASRQAPADGARSFWRALARSEEDIEAARKERLERALHHLGSIGAGPSPAARGLLDALESKRSDAPAGSGR